MPGARRRAENRVSQSRRHSALEAVANVAVGFVVSVLGQLAIFSVLVIPVAWEQNVVIGLWFTGLSLARSYGLRRLFDGWAA